MRAWAFRPAPLLGSDDPCCVSFAFSAYPSYELALLSVPPSSTWEPAHRTLLILFQSPQRSQHSPLEESSPRWQVPALAWQETTSPFLRRWVQPRSREQMRAQRQSPSSRYTTSHGSCSAHTFCSSTATGGEAETRAAGTGGVATKAPAVGQAEMSVLRNPSATSFTLLTF